MLIGYWLGSYLLGTVLTAYLLGKWKGVDLRTQHSGNLGARNAGRSFGKLGFVLTMVGDALKGAIVILVGRALDLSEMWMAVGVLCVVLGHIFPFWLQFRGGKGVATGIGSLLFFSPVYVLAFLVGFVLSYLLLRSATLSMVCGFTAYIGYLCAIGRFDLWALMVMLVVLIVAHRQNIQERRG